MSRFGRCRPPAPGRAAAGLAVLAWALAGGPAVAESLEEALAGAYGSNPTLLAARAELRAVNEGVAQELSNYRPSAFLDGTAGIQRIDTDPSLQSAETTRPLEAIVDIEQPLYRGGRTVAGVARAEADVAAQRAVLASVEQRVLLDAVRAYMDVWRDEAVLELTQNNERVLSRQLEATRDRFEVGELTRTDVAQSESRLARATAARVAAEGDLAASRAVYLEVVGTEPGELAEADPPENLPAVLDEVTERARRANPEVVSARFARESAVQQIAVARGQLLPEAFLTGEASRSEATTTQDSEIKRLRGQLEVTVPLYQSGRVSSQVRESKQRAGQRAYTLEEARRRAERQAIEAWEDLQAARAQSVSFEAQVRASAIALEGVRQENAVGARTILDILDAEQEFLDARVSLTRSRRDEVVAGYAVLAATGRLSARELNLAVEPYDPEADYRAVRTRWFGLDAPGAETSE